jgi:hypothetical protein
LTVLARSLVLAMATWIPGQASAQETSRVDVEVGLGRAIGGAPKSPGTTSIGLTGWFSQRWGLTLVHVRGFGFDAFDLERDAGDRVELGTHRQRYYRVAVRYRRRVGPSLTLVAGAGLVLDGTYADAGVLRTESGLRLFERENMWGGFSGEFYVEAPFLPHVAMRVGATWDSNRETTVMQPVFSAVVSF